MDECLQLFGGCGYMNSYERSHRAEVLRMMPPLRGIRIVEFEGLGPGPLAGRMLADMGAEVTLIRRPQAIAVAQRLGGGSGDSLRLGKVEVTLDLKQPPAVVEAMNYIASADALIEGNRPGVMERLGLGPAQCAARNPKLVYGRMTGWGQKGPLAHTAGHDLNYVALSGLLSLSAHRGERPIVPPTVLGDASGALGLAFGIVCALIDAGRTGRGRIVDAAIIDVLGMLGTIAMWVRSSGQIDGPSLSAFHDSPFYDVYACSDGRYITLGALEPQFYARLLRALNFDDVDPQTQYDASAWPALKRRFQSLFATQPLAHWNALLEGTDTCFAPVLNIAEAAAHPHNVARDLYRIAPDGSITTRSAPRFLPLEGE
jgi:alpha-methylacyl-CoA racemase